jgi:hypothetical protein
VREGNELVVVAVAVVVVEASLPFVHFLEFPLSMDMPEYD